MLVESSQISSRIRLPYSRISGKRGDILGPFYIRISQGSSRVSAANFSEMVLLEKLWDDVVAGPRPERGLGKLRKINPSPLNVKEAGGGQSSKKFQKSQSVPATPATPATPTTPSSARTENVWRSVFSPGSNLNTKGFGAQYFDKPNPNSPSVYDWLYSKDSKSEHR